MAFRTPVPSFVAVNFVENGEQGNQTVLNRPMHALDDKIQYVYESLLTEVTASSRLANMVGEDYRNSCSASFPDLPCWTSPVNFGANVNHHSAIEALDVAVGANDTKVSTIEFQLGNIVLDIGEDPNNPAFPDWETTRTVFAIQQNDTHHQAIERLDIEASRIDSVVTNNISRISTAESLLDFHGSHLSTLDSRLSLTRSVVSTIDSQLDITNSQLDITNSQAAITNSQLSITNSAVSVLESQISIMQTQISCIIATAAPGGGLAC